MLVLRGYQQQAVDHILKRLSEGCMRMYFTLPVGTGKSVILAALGQQSHRSGRILVLIHRQDIAKQLAETFKQADLRVGLLMQGYRNIDAQVVVATIQSLTSVTIQNLISVREQPIITIFIDEAHHAFKGSAYDHITATLEEAYQQAIPVIGCTATPYRSDKRSMLSFLPTCAFARDIPDMVRDRCLSPLVWKPLHLDIDLSKVSIDTQAEEKDYGENALAFELVRDAINKEIAQQAAPSLQQRPTLVFAVSIEHAEQLAQAFSQLGFSAKAVSGKQKRTEREQLFADWRVGKTQIVCNCSLLTEGFDFPEISALVIARPTLSPSLYMQMLGRGIRLAAGKKDCLVLDVMGNDPDTSRQIVLPHLVGGIEEEDVINLSSSNPLAALSRIGNEEQGKGNHIVSNRKTTDPLLKAIYGTNTPSLSLLDPIGQSRYRWLPYRLRGFEGYLARISQYEGAIIERDPEGSGLYRSRLYEKQPRRGAIHTWIEHQYLPLRQQVALVHEATDAHYSKALGGKEEGWLRQQATEKQLQLLQDKHPQAAQEARLKKWTGQKVSDLITFLSMKGALTNPPPLPQEMPNDAA